MASIDKENFYAKPELRTRLIQLHGHLMGYREFLSDGLLAASGQTASTGFLGRIINGTQPTPPWMILGITRIVEEDYELSRDGAYALSPSWFTVRAPKRDDSE